MSSSSLSSSDGLNFIINDSNNEIIMPVVQHLVEHQQDPQHLVFLLQLQQATKELTPYASKPRVKKRCIKRDREQAHERLYMDYFADDPIYNDHHFHRRFRMQMHLFLQIVEALGNHSEYIQLRHDTTGKRGLTPLTKCTAVMCMLKYGIAADCVDEYLKISASTALKCMKKFCLAIPQVFGDEYLRKPNQADVDRVLQVAQACDFFDMLECIDCMHWEWKNCPTGWNGAFPKRLYKVQTIILEAVASYDTWIYHAFFGLPGNLNYINVLDCCPVSQELMKIDTEM